MANHFITVGGVQVVTRIEPSRLILSKQSEKVFLTKSEQGPPGPAGPGGSISHTETASTAIGGHRAIINTAAGVAYADASDPTHIARVVGVTTSAAASGAIVSFQASGNITEPSWTWTPDGDIYLGLNGLLTQSIPGTAAFAQRLGFALSPTEMWVELGEPIVF